MSKNQDYKAIISQYVKKQMIILGPVVAVEKARKISKIKLKDDGSVTQINGDGEEIMAMVESAFEGMIGGIAHTILLRVIDSHERKGGESDSRLLEIDSHERKGGESDSRAFDVPQRALIESEPEGSSLRVERPEIHRMGRLLEIDKTSVGKGES